jgi:DNA-directed RNA polymerase subunit M/transcription elongation factor TFIIS
VPYKSSAELRAYNREYYRRNRERLLRKQAEKNKRFFESRRKWLVEYKKTLKCARCGESHPATLTFHHKRRSEKKFEIGNALILKVSFKRLLAEIEKCEVICANCHAKEHLSYLFE